jgi:hypothetical protein
MVKAIRLRVRPKAHNTINVSVMVPSASGGWYNAGALHVSEVVWRLLLYPVLLNGARTYGVELTLEP